MHEQLQLVLPGALDEKSRVQSDLVASVADDFLAITPLDLGPTAAAKLHRLIDRLSELGGALTPVIDGPLTDKQRAFDSFFHIERVDGNPADVLVVATIKAAAKLADELRSPYSMNPIERNHLFAALQAIVASLAAETNP